MGDVVQFPQGEKHWREIEFIIRETLKEVCSSS